AFYERRKIHDLIMEGIDAVLKQISICRGPQSGQKAMNEPCQVWGGALGEGVAGYTSDAASAPGRLSFDHLVSERQQFIRHVEAERLRRPEVYDHLELGRQHDR